MNKPPSPPENLPGLDADPVGTPSAPNSSTAARARVKPVDRSQLTWQMLDVERLIGEDHPARAIWALVGRLNLEGFYAPIAAREGSAGRTPWDPRLLVSLWIYAYSQGISSAREMARRCTYEPAFQWLCGLSEINHHTLSDFRVDYDASLRELFVQVLGVLSSEGLVSLERVMHDGTKIKACAGADSFRREERLREHLEAARKQVEAMGDPREEEPARKRAAQERAVRERQQRLEQALEEVQKVREAKRQDKEQARASQSDPQARIMKQSDGGYAPSYNVQLSTEASNRIIVGAEVSQNGSDFGHLIGSVAQVEANLGKKPAQVVVDGGFTSRENIMAMAQQGVDLIGSLPEANPSSAGQQRQRGVSEKFHLDKFSYDAQQDICRCPAGASLTAKGREFCPGVVLHKYVAKAEVCAACPFRSECCPGNQHHGRSVVRAVQAAEVRQFAEKMQTETAKSIYKQRGAVAEFPNAWLKDKLGLRQFRLRGLIKVKLEVLWAALTYNIQQWIRLSWQPSLAAANN
ncbi:MAG TPA: IS1182 family transposase [Candidatus Sulfotelmatobacter sp.]|nr:IS1182 family transposase [Candidatus Sulfotelmatobacter sp.]